MRLRVFWPVLVLLGVPNMVVLYWEDGYPEYADMAACEARLPRLEQGVLNDRQFMSFVREVNEGQLPDLSFSRECIDKPPPVYREELLRKPGPGERT